jgi:hypothetical protein
MLAPRVILVLEQIFDYENGGTRKAHMKANSLGKRANA